MNKKKSKVLAFLLATAMLVPSANGIVSAAEVVKNVPSIEENKRVGKVVDVSNEDEFLEALEDINAKEIKLKKDMDLTYIKPNAGIVFNVSGKKIDLCGKKLQIIIFP